MKTINTLKRHFDSAVVTGACVTGRLAKFAQRFEDIMDANNPQ